MLADVSWLSADGGHVPVDAGVLHPLFSAALLIFNCCFGSLNLDMLEKIFPLLVVLCCILFKNR